MKQILLSGFILTSLWSKSQTATYTVHHNGTDTLFQIVGNDSLPLLGDMHTMLWSMMYGNISNNTQLASVLAGKAATSHTHTGVYQPVGTYATGTGTATGTNTGDQTITLTGDVTGSGTGSFVTTFKTSPSFTTPIIGAATGTSLSATGAITSSGGGIGYATGNGGTVTQATSKATGVTLNKLAGDITLNAASLAAATVVSFTLTNSTIAATDIIYLQHQTTGTFGAYTLSGRTAAGSAVISIRNNTAGALAEAIVIKYIVIKSVNN